MLKTGQLLIKLSMREVSVFIRTADNKKKIKGGVAQTTLAKRLSYYSLDSISTDGLTAFLCYTKAKAGIGIELYRSVKNNKAFAAKSFT